MLRETCFAQSFTIRIRPDDLILSPFPFLYNSYWPLRCHAENSTAARACRPIRSVGEPTRGEPKWKQSRSITSQRTAISRARSVNTCKSGSATIWGCYSLNSVPGPYLASTWAPRIVRRPPAPLSIHSKPSSKRSPSRRTSIRKFQTRWKSTGESRCSPLWPTNTRSRAPVEINGSQSRRRSGLFLYGRNSRMPNCETYSVPERQKPGFRRARYISLC